MMLAVVTMALGLLVALTRIPGVVKPRLFRRLVTALLDSMPASRMAGGVALVFAVLLFVAVEQAEAFAEFIIVALAVILAVGGVVFALGASGVRRALKAWIETMPDLALRTLCLLGALIGIALIVLGYVVYLPTDTPA